MVKEVYQEEMDRMAVVILPTQQIPEWMKLNQHLSVIMESVPVLWDGDYRAASVMVSSYMLSMKWIDLSHRIILELEGG